MITRRRDFLHTIGTGAIGLGFASSIPAALAQNSKPIAPRRKFVFRADDVGYTDVCNIGAFEAITGGVVSSADTMLDTPGTVDALKRLKALPWITVGWHAHFWGAPVTDPTKVPSLVMREDGRIRFRKDLHQAKDVDYDQALLECRAQIERCRKILGRAPDTGAGGNPATPLGRAMAKMCEEFGIVVNFASRQSIPKKGPVTFSPVDPKWAPRKIFQLDPLPTVPQLISETATVAQVDQYDPMTYFTENRGRLDEFAPDAILEQSWHPGYVDYYVYKQGDYTRYSRTFIAARTVDVEFLTSDRLKNWIKQNNIEIVNYRDALYGTHEFQNHLKKVGSDLCVI